MKDYFAPVVKEFDYAAFIDEMKLLIEQAKAFGISERKHDGDEFRAWRHKVANLTTKISRTHVDSDSTVEHRQFRVMSYGSVSGNDQLQAFDRDLHDTLVELDHIVEQYTKYGEPKLRAGMALKLRKAEPIAPAVAGAFVEPPKPVEPEWPSKEKLTLYWVLKNMPLSSWGWLAVLVGGAFSFGLTAGNWPAVQRKFDHWAEASKVATPPVKAASAP